MGEVDPIRELLAEGLDLCVRARKLDEQATLCSLDKYHPSPEGPRCITPHIWVIDQYEKDLADWEARARKALS